MADLVPLSELVDVVDEYMRASAETRGPVRTVPCLDFTESVGNGGCGIRGLSLMYRVGVGGVGESVDAYSAALLVSNVIHESYHEHQIMHVIGDGRHDRMLVDWAGTSFDTVFYNATLHENTFELDAYRHALVEARPIMRDLFGADGESVLLKTYMDRARTSDTIYFTKKKRCDYTDIDSYVSDVNAYEASLSGRRRPYRFSDIYGDGARVRNHGVRVDQVVPDSWFSFLTEAEDKTRDAVRAFTHARDGFAQVKTVALFESFANRAIGVIVPRIEMMDRRVEIRPRFLGFP